MSRQAPATKHNLLDIVTKGGARLRLGKRGRFMGQITITYEDEGSDVTLNRDEAQLLANALTDLMGDLLDPEEGDST